MRLPLSHALPFALILFSTSVEARDAPAHIAPVTGPAADYPVVVGEPFKIDNTVWTPTDQLNYDAVGYASTGDAALAGVTAAHKTLPLPSYVEVTTLDTGKTILVRLEKRGPMVNDLLIQLSPAAAAQLGMAPGFRSPVRVRRVNPPEQERALLRTGGHAPERMETPEGLLKVLRRKLADQSPLLPPPSIPPTMPKGAPSSLPSMLESTKNAQAGTTAPSAGATQSISGISSPKPRSVNPKKVTDPTPGVPASIKKGATEARGSLMVQVAALSVETNARNLANQLGGSVHHAGKFWHVRLGPFANGAQAAAALEKARHAGYRDARIQSAD